MNTEFQLKFNAIIHALMQAEWGHACLLLIELKALQANPLLHFSNMRILADQADFIEQEFSFSEDELMDLPELIQSIETYLSEQAQDE